MKETPVTSADQVKGLRHSLDFDDEHAQEWFEVARMAEKEGEPALARKLAAFGLAIVNRRSAYISKAMEDEIAAFTSRKFS